MTPFSAIEKTLSKFTLKQKLCASLCLGGLSALSMAPTYLTFILAITLPLLLLLQESSKTKKESFLIAGGWSLGFFTLSLYWVSFSLTQDLSNYWWAMPFAILGLPFILSLFFGLAGVLYHILAKNKHNGAIKALCFACIFSLLDIARGYLFTGFPWNMLGYGWGFSLSIMQITSIIGIWGLSFLTWFIFTLFFYKRGAVLGVTLILCLFIFGQWRLTSQQDEWHETHKIALIQPNILQIDKWNNAKEYSNFKTLINLTKQAIQQHQDKTQSLLVVWPETALTYIPKTAPEIKAEIDTLVKKSNIILITGGLDFERTANKIDYFNSVFVINSQNKNWERYDKKHLVPFGEYMPLKEYLPVTPLTQQGFTPALTRRNIQLNDLTITPLICYEAIFSGQVTSQNSDSNLLLNVTNDAWYNHSIGPYQHHDITKTRAIEEGIPLIRVANTGISSITTGLGRSVYMTKYGNDAIIYSKIPKSLQYATFYAKYKHTILWSLVVFFSTIPLLCLRFSSKE